MTSNYCSSPSYHKPGQSEQKSKHCEVIVSYCLHIKFALPSRFVILNWVYGRFVKATGSSRSQLFRIYPN